MTFDSKEDIPLEEKLIKENMDTLEKVRIPKRFEKSKIKEILEKKIKTDLSEDPFNKRIIKLMKYASNFFEKHTLYFELIFDFHKDLAKRLNSNILFTSRTYLISELPSSFEKTISLSFMTQLKMLKILDARIHHERMELIAVRKNRVKFDRICESHNRWVQPLLDSLDDMIENRTRLIWFLDFNESKTLSEIFKPKAYISAFDREEYFLLITLLQKSVDTLRSLLIKTDVEHYVDPEETEHPTTELYAHMAQVFA
jgi:hypothetical protein